MNFFGQYVPDSYYQAQIKVDALGIRNDTNNQEQVAVFFAGQNGDFIGRPMFGTLNPGQSLNLPYNLMPRGTVSFWVEVGSTGQGLQVPVGGEVTVSQIIAQGSVLD